MTTATALEAITDRSRFEYLATSVLRKADARYAGIIHTGVNAKGETIVSPVDGLHLIPHSRPPHYVFVQHTTTDRERLRGKWLAAEDADLPKAVQQARAVRRNHPEAIFTVVLTTNQRVDPGLVLDVNGRAETDRVAVDIWEQTRLADFLDTTPDGQWLRRRYLGVEADRLSADLLHYLGRQSLDLYRQEVIPPHHHPLVDRAGAKASLGAAEGGGLCLVVGRSGFGKSVATAQALLCRLTSGGLGVWLPAHVLDRAASLEAALDTWLRVLHPPLQAGAGRVAIQLGASQGGLMVCLDDVNREPDSARGLRLAAWAAAPSAAAADNSRPGTGGGGQVSRVHVVVPLWPEQLTALPAGLTNQPWVQTIQLAPFLPTESVEVIRRAVPRLSGAAAEAYAARLGHDPLLVGLFATTAGDGMSDAELASAAADAIGRFIDSQVHDLGRVTGVDLLPAEFLAALNRVAHEMLSRRAGRPSWADVAEWLGEELQTLRALRALVRQGSVCRLDDESRIVFRHDRLRDRFLSKSVADLLRASDLAEEIIADPYYAAVVGSALAATPVSGQRLGQIRRLAPWALFEAVRQIGEPAGSHQEQVFAEACAWATVESRSAPEQVLMAIFSTLLETDSSRAPFLIDAFEPNWVLMAAGLRNGSATHGMRFIRGSVRGHFEPGMGDRLRDRIVEHATLRHGSRIAQQLREGLSSPHLTSLDTNAYLALLGHCRFPGFDDLILTAWKRHGDDALSYTIWAAARCPVADTKETLRPLIGRLAALPAREPGAREVPEREWLTGYLAWAFRRGITCEALHYLVEVAHHDAGLLRDVAHMLSDVDHPDAAEFRVRYLARGGSGHTIGDGEPEVSLRSSPTVDRLRTLWEADSEEENVRVQALIAWLRGTGCHDARQLRHLGPESPLYETAVQHRVKLADRTAVPDLLSLLRGEVFWWWMTYRVWCDELREFASEVLASFKGKIPTDFSRGQSDYIYLWAELLVRLPVSDSVALLAANWGHLKYSPAMVQAAYRIGTPESVALAEESLDLCPREVDIFHLAFSTVWEQPNPANPLTMRHLRNLEPHLHRMDEGEILFLAWATERAIGSDESIANWIRQHLIPRLGPESQTRVQVADQMFIANLDRQSQETQFGPHLGFLFDERGGQRFVFPERQLGILGDWLSTHRTVRGLAVAGECLRHIGARCDLELLDRFPLTGDPAEVDRVKAGARFSVMRRTLD